MSIRVLQIVTYMGRGGLETMLMNYYRHIDREKVQFDFLVHRDFKADYDDEIRSLGGRIYHMPRLIPWSKLYRRKLKAFFRQHPEYQIVHVHQDCLSAVALQCAKECNIPVRIAHSHNSNQDKNIKFIIKKLYMKQIPLYATHLMACSQSAGQWMFGQHAFHVLPNAINLSDYSYSNEKARSVRKEFGLEDKFIIGHIGRFDPQKNHSFLIDIFAECLKKSKDVRLMLIGNGKDRQHILQKIKKLDIEKYVILTGVRSDVNLLLQAMDVFVFPSLYEGLPVTLIEAQAAGLPCIISDCISSESIVTKHQVQKMSLSDSPERWAELIMNQYPFSRDAHEQGNEIRQAGYDIMAEAKKLEKFYLRKSGI